VEIVDLVGLEPLHCLRFGRGLQQVREAMAFEAAMEFHK
jgi:hypothetical protein